MNQRIVAINDKVHDQVQKLIPWFVVDTLHGEELALVNQHLNVCPECQADFAWQCKLQAIQPAVQMDLDKLPDVDRAFAKLRVRIDTKQPGTTRQSLWSGLQRWTKWAHDRNRPWVPWALAIQFIALIVLVVRIATPDTSIATYRALGAINAADGNLIVLFKPDTTERDLRRSLNQVQARIVDGPTVTDAYLLNVPDEKLSAVVIQLRSDPAVQLAEPLKDRP